MQIREAIDADWEDVLSVEREAFGYDKEAQLVKDLLGDPSAKPLFSFLAVNGDEAVGHVLFTSARLEGAPGNVSISLLAPLAVIPGYRNQGIGGKLISGPSLVLADSMYGVANVFFPYKGPPEHPSTDTGKAPGK